MNNISARILQLIREKNISYGELARVTGISKSALFRYASGKTDKIPMDRLVLIANALGVEASTLMGWVTPAVAYAPLTDKKSIPLLKKISAGTPILAVQNIEGYEMVDDTMLDYALKVVGNSMINARISDGDIVFVSRQCPFQNGDIVVVLINDEDATLKRFYQYNNSKIILKPENSTLKETEYPVKDVKILGKVKQVRFNL